MSSKRCALEHQLKDVEDVRVTPVRKGAGPIAMLYSDSDK